MEDDKNEESPAESEVPPDVNPEPYQDSSSNINVATECKSLKHKNDCHIFKGSNMDVESNDHDEVTSSVAMVTDDTETKEGGASVTMVTGSDGNHGDCEQNSVDQTDENELRSQCDRTEIENSSVVTQLNTDSEGIKIVSSNNCDLQETETDNEKIDSSDIEAENNSSIHSNEVQEETGFKLQHPSSLPVSVSVDSLLTLSSAESSRPASLNISPAASPALVPSYVIETNQKNDARNAQTLEDIQGDIQSVISQSFAMISSDPPSSAGSEVDIETTENKISENVLQDNRDIIIPVTKPSEEPKIHEQEFSSDNLNDNIPEMNANDTKINLSETVTSNIDTAENKPDLNLPLAKSKEVDDDNDELLSELDAELTSTQTEHEKTDPPNDEFCIEAPNGLRQKINLLDIPDFKEMKIRNKKLSEEQTKTMDELKRIKSFSEQQNLMLTSIQAERDEYKTKLQQLENSSTDDIYMAQIKELEITIVNQETEVKQAKEKLEAHDGAAKRAVASLQNELKAHIDKVKKMYEDCRKEKESMTMKYAQSEAKNLELQQKQGRMELQMKDMTKERETVIARFKVIKSEKLKMQEMFDSRAAEIGALRREVEKHRDALQSADLKIKWHQNKLKMEGDSHKETKAKVEEFQRRLNQAKEETEQIRRNCQAMVKTYQESDDIKSNSLGKELKVKEEKLQQHLQEKSDQDEVHLIVKRELESLKKKQKDAIEEVKTMRDKITCLEAERITQEHTLDKFRETLQGQKKENKELHDRVFRLKAAEEQLSSYTSEVKTLEVRIQELETNNRDFQIDMEGCAKRESEHLEFSQKITKKNALLQSANNAVNTKLLGVTAEHERILVQCKELETTVQNLEAALSEEKKLRDEETNGLSQALHVKSKAVEELSRQVEEEKDENRTLKRKHTANVKDVTRQLHQARKRLEAYEQNKNPGERDSVSVGSRTSSNGSLDTLGTSGNPGIISRGSSQEPSAHEEAPPFVEVVEVDRNMLLEKIVRLQKSHARKNEKLEFMEDHINQLVTELQKKTKIIQNYIMREESGILVPESMDRNKALLAKKGGIMASLYNSHVQDGAMNLDLSLEINHKLQSVLEDTLLKNITLKENIETLGEEIARISRENRQLQLSLQSLMSKDSS